MDTCIHICKPFESILCQNDANINKFEKILGKNIKKKTDIEAKDEPPEM